MKRLLQLAVAALILSQTQFAFAGWRKIAECDGGAATVDHDGFRAQLVIRNDEINSYLVNSRIGMFNPFNTREVIYGFSPSSNRDFDWLDFDGRVMHTLRFNYDDSLSFDIFRASSPTGGLLLRGDRIGGWLFRDCRRF